jgi:hypothetical protein
MTGGPAGRLPPRTPEQVRPLAGTAHVKPSGLTRRNPSSRQADEPDPVLG